MRAQRNKRRRFLALLLLIIGLLAAGWAALTVGDWTVPNWRHTVAGVGSLVGIAGYLLFVSSLLLSTRWGKLEDWIGGLDRVYSLHHKIGVWAFAFIVIHPWFYPIRWIPRHVDRFFLFVLPHHRAWSLNLASIAYWGLILLIGLTLLKRLPYDKWKLTHKLMSVVFLLISLHIALLHKRFEIEAVPHALLYLPMGIGLLCIIYKQIISDWLVKKTPAETTAVTHLNAKLVQIDFRFTKTLVPFIPGQYAFFSFRHRLFSRESHPFTLCSESDSITASIIVKARGDFTQKLYEQISPHTPLRIEGPYGRFDYRQGGLDQIWIGGGVGIAPFLAWARSIGSQASADKHSIDLIYCVHCEEEALSVEEFAQLSTAHPSFRFHAFWTVEKGHLTGAAVEKLCGALTDKDIFMCGPRGMTRDLTKQFLSLGVKRDRLIFEDFEFF